MIGPSHEKDGFFKYYTAEAAKRTLHSTDGGWLTNGFDGSAGMFEPDALTLEQSFLSGEAS